MLEPGIFVTSFVVESEPPSFFALKVKQMIYVYFINSVKFSSTNFSFTVYF